LLPLGFGLGRGVAAFAILGPVERKPVSHKPVSDIRPTDGAARHHALVSVAIYLDAFDRATVNEVEQRIRCFLPAAVWAAVRVVAKLIGFGRIDSEYANAGAVNFDGVAVDTDACPNSSSASAAPLMATKTTLRKARTSDTIPCHRDPEKDGRFTPARHCRSGPL